MNKFAELKKKLKREDFEFLDGWFERRVRPPASMHEQQFQVSDCQNSRLSIFDPSACVYIDECANSWFFVGPCEASVFIRDCRGCTVICCCRQFRMRGCKDCRIALWCESQPVIESSQGIEFDCFPDIGYKGLAQQFEVMKFSVWNNNWWDVYDFTKSREGQPPNHSYRKFSSEELRLAEYMEDLNQAKCQFQQGIVPLVYGSTVEAKQTIVYCVEHPYVNAFRNPRLRLLKSKLTKIGESEAERLGIPANRPLVFLQFEEEDLKQAEQILRNSNAKLVTRFTNLTSEEYCMIFVPFKDHH